MTEFCCKCHLSFGLAEKRVPIDAMRRMHQDCYEKHLRELSARASARLATVAVPLRRVNGSGRYG